MSRGGDDEIVLHDLWRSLLPLPPVAQRRDALSRLGRALQARGDLTSALEMFITAEDFDGAEPVLRLIARDYALEYPLAARRQMVQSMPAELRARPVARLIAADLVFAHRPEDAVDALDSIADDAGTAGDAEIAAQALLRLGELRFRTQDGAELGVVLDRLDRLGTSDSVPVAAISTLVQVWQAMATNGYHDAAALLRTQHTDRYEPTAAHGDFYRIANRIHTGHGQSNIDALTDVLPRLRGRHAQRAGGMESQCRFRLGQMDEQRREAVWRLVESIRDDGLTHLFVEGACTVVLYSLAAGDVTRAREQFAEVQAAIARLSEGSWGHHVMAMCRVVFLLHDGDEVAAAELLEATMPPGGPFDGLARHVYFNIAALAYVLVPRSRPVWEADVCGPDQTLAREVGAALVSLRDDNDPGPASRLPWNELQRIRAWAFEPHLAELAVGALTRDRAEASAAIASLRHDPYAALARVRDRYTGPVAKRAETLLAKTPRRPSTRLSVAVLGPMEVIAGGATHTASAVRSRVVELLQLLIEHRRMTRDQVIDQMWPTLQGASARNNLRVNLAHLNKMIEPDRSDSPPWHVRSDGDYITLVASPFLTLDVDEFLRSIESAKLEDKSGLPGTAIAHYQAACELYRGDYLTESALTDIGGDNRVALRLAFVDAATRGAELLVVDARPGEALHLAERAVEVEPLTDAAHAVRLEALRALGREVEAGHAAVQCRRLYADLGLSPGSRLEHALRAAVE